MSSSGAPLATGNRRYPSMQDHPKVTVFVQVYNTERFVEACLDSVLAQDFEGGLEVIVIDDGSVDASWEIIAGFDDARVRAIRHAPNQGANATANEGYLAAKGEFVLRLDSDDRLRPGFLRRSLDLLQSDERVGFTFTDIALIDENGTVTSPEGNVNRPPGELVRDEFFSLLRKNYVPAPTTLVRRSALTEALPVPPSYQFLDWFITLTIAENWKAGFIDAPLAEYRVHPGNGHPSVVRSGEDERISFELLDKFFATKTRQAEKRRNRREVYSSISLDLADKYFGYDMARNARRMYWRAIKNRPALALQPAVARRFLASILSKRLYNAAKARLRSEHYHRVPRDH